ncbi:MAG: polyprenyl synthetase family protein [Corynebacterium sp.]|nr:polyprenyl synthetase family protein [Corynebacterium sp.]
MTYSGSSAIYSIDRIPKIVEDELKAFFSARRPLIAEIGQPVADSIGFLESFVLGGGKRIRPLYAWAGFMAAHGHTSEEPCDAMLRAASSLELIQACALIHDDIVDSSDTRRGNPTVHRSVEALHREAEWNGDSAEYGRSIAILVGDMALSWSDDMLRNSGLSLEALRRAQEPWQKMRTEVVGGQLLDLIVESSGTESLELADAVNRFKTAAYTIERPLHFGAAIAGGSQELISTLRNYGRDIGIAFQLRDDILGVYGDTAVTGKPIGDDLSEGKRTVLLNLALRSADTNNPQAAATLRQLIGKSQDPADIATMTQIISDSGAPEQIEQRISALTESGLSHITDVPMPDEVREILRELAIKSTARKK